MPVSTLLLACLAAAFAIGLAGCAGAPESPSTPAALARKQHALSVARAAEYCREKGLEMRPGGADTPTRPGQLVSDFQFRCVKAR